jgi:hypothetical protein
MSGIHRSLVWRSCDLVIVSMHVPKCQDDLSRKCDQCEQHEPMTMKPKVTHYYIITGAPGFGVAELSREQRNVAFWHLADLGAAVEDVCLRVQTGRRHCQTNLSGPAKGSGLKRSGRQLTPLG